MAEVSDTPKKKPEDHVPEKTETSKAATDSPSAKLYEAVGDYQKSTPLASNDAAKKDGAASDMLKLNPLGDLSRAKAELSDDKLCKLDSSKPSDDLGDFLMSSYYSSTVDKNSEGGLWNGLKGLVSKVSNEASKLTDEASKIGNATISWLTGDKASDASDHPGVKTTLMGDKTIIKAGPDSIIQGPTDANGKHDVTVATNDGRTVTQDKNTGERIASNANSDLTLKQDPRTGRVEAYDKSGNEVAEFNNKGDAARFFQNSIAQVVQPPQSLDDAYKAFAKEHPDKLKEEPIILLDGKGESLTVRPDGSTLRTHANGNAEAVYKHWTHDGAEHDIQVNVVKGPDGKEHFTVGHVGEEQHELSSDAARKIMEHSRLRYESGRLMVNDDPSGKLDEHRWRHLVNEKHEIEVFNGGKVDLSSGKTTIDDDRTHAVYTPNKDTGTTTLSETNRHPDGSLDPNPSRITTMDHGKITSQGEDPNTGQMKPNDVISYDSNSGVLDAWNMIMSQNNVDVRNPDGSWTSIDPNGDINAFDKNGDSIVQTSGDEISYDGGKSYSSVYSAERVQEARDLSIKAQDAVMDVSQAIQAIDVHLSDNMSLSELSGLESSLDAAIKKCLDMGLPIPSQVMGARVELIALQLKAAQREHVLQAV